MIRAGGDFFYIYKIFYIYKFFYASCEKLTKKFSIYKITWKKFFIIKKIFTLFKKSDAGGLRESKDFFCLALLSKPVSLMQRSASAREMSFSGYSFKRSWGLIDAEEYFNSVRNNAEINLISFDWIIPLFISTIFS